MSTPSVSGAYWTPALSQVPVQTASYTASPNQVVPVSTASGNVTITLPTGAPAGSIVAVKMVTLGGSNTVTVNAVAGDAFNKSGGGTTATLSLQSQGMLLEYQSGIWMVLSDDLPLTQLEALFLPVPTGTATSGYVPIASGTGQGSAWGPASAASLPLTTLGDLLYENATPAPARLAGNTTATKNFLTQTGTGSASAAPAWGTVASGDLPAATTSAQGAVILDGTATDIQNTGPQAAGNSTKAAAANHVHFSSGQYLCTPTSYAPASQTLLGLVTSTFTVPGLLATVASGSNGGEISAVASWSSPSAGVLDVASTAGFPSSGTLYVSATGPTVATITYTGTSGGNSFTGCAYVSGSATGTVATGGTVVLAGAGALISTGSFTAPASGSVVVNAYLIGQIGVTSNSIAWTLFGHGTTTQYGNIINYPVQAANNRTSFPLPFIVTGLTPGSSYNFDLAAAVTLGQQFEIYAFGTNTASPTFASGGNGAPATMIVQAV